MKRFIIDSLKLFAKNIFGGMILIVFVSLLFVSYDWFENITQPKILSLKKPSLYDWRELDNPEQVEVIIENLELENEILVINVLVNNNDKYRYNAFSIDVALYVDDFQINNCRTILEYLNIGVNQRYQIRCHDVEGTMVPGNLIAKLIGTSGGQLIPKLSIN